MIGFVAIIVQNLGNTQQFDLGLYTAIVPSTALIFFAKFAYILFWTWVLNLICKDGNSGFAWFLVLVPFILLFVLLGLVLLSG